MRRIAIGSLLGLLLVACSPEADDATEARKFPAPRADSQTDRFALLALDCVHREYPNKISHVLESDADALPPSQLTPAFYGCFDWHSSVHGHWLLARLARTDPDTPMREAILAALDRSLTEKNIAGSSAIIPTAIARRSSDRMAWRGFCNWWPSWTRATILR